MFSTQRIPILFLMANTFIMSYVIVERTLESLIGLGIMLIGIVLYIINRRWGVHSVIR
jgi:hypothetical protein